MFVSVLQLMDKKVIKFIYRKRIFRSHLRAGVVTFFLLFGFANSTLKAQIKDNVDNRLFYQEALEWMNAFQFDKAMQLLSECHIHDQENIDYLLKIAYCNTQMGRYPDAKLFYQKALKLDSINTNALSSLGSIYERENNYQAAEKQYLRLITIDSTNSYYFKRNGYTALHLNKTIQGITYFLKAHELNEGDVEVIDQLSDIYLALDQLEYAERILRKGLSIDPNNIKLLYNQARLFQKQKDYPTVAFAIEKAMSLGDTSDYYQMMLGVAYLRIDSLEKSVFHLNRIVARGKDSDRTHHYLGLAYKAMGEMEKSIEHLEIAIEKGISEQMGTYQSDLASILMLENRYKEAIEHYKAAYQYEANAEYLFHLANSCDLYYKDKQPALKYYDQYLSRNDPKFREYATQRIKQLKEIIHLSKR
ncbi:MAG: tetratricopeptide repeat protein [Saprospiraceae bacterium]